MADRLQIIPVGGLGGSQFRAIGFWWWKAPGIIDALKQIPDVVVFTNSGRDEFKGDGIWDFINLHPDLPVHLLGHSLGVDTAIHAANALGARCQGLSLVAPVWNDKPQPSCPCQVFKPTSSIFPQANVTGVTAVTVPNTDHNSICHASEVIAAIVKACSGGAA